VGAYGHGIVRPYLASQTSEVSLEGSPTVKASLDFGSLVSAIVPAVALWSYRCNEIARGRTWFVQECTRTAQFLRTIALILL
jgi:hypothetical protein